MEDINPIADVNIHVPDANVHVVQANIHVADANIAIADVTNEHRGHIRWGTMNGKCLASC